MKKTMQSHFILLAAILLGILSGLTQQKHLLMGAQTIATLFMNFFKLIAAPIVFLSIFSTLLNMLELKEMKTIGKKVILYTILTTVIAATAALVFFLILNPVQEVHSDASGFLPEQKSSYASFLLQIIPSNFVKAFLDNHVIGIAFIAFILGLASFKLSNEDRQTLSRFFSVFFKLTLKATESALFFMPIVIWAFTTNLIDEILQGSSHFKNLALYLCVVLGANLFQGLIVLPLLLKLKKISPLQTAKQALPALMLAFFSKSSNATLPMSLQCAEKQMKIQPKIAQFSLPLCTIINMNGCAAFILATTLFVLGINHHTFTAADLGLWVVLATVAAIGNAGVPMGCFFLSSAFLIAMDVPITIMGAILPFYAFLDMVETALNVWSDLSVTAIVDKELRQSNSILDEAALNL
jgi:Na+/H+-dicarboxylate symporter